MHSWHALKDPFAPRLLHMLPALLLAQPAKIILKILKTPRWLGNPCISRLNGAPLLLAGQAGLILNILKTPSSPEPAGDYRALMEVPPENMGCIRFFERL